MKIFLKLTYYFLNNYLNNFKKKIILKLIITII